MGNVLQKKGDLEAAIDSYKQALKIKPDYAEAYSYLGIAFIGVGNRDNALLNLKKSHELIRGKDPVNLFHKSFLTISKAKIDHDIDQFNYLADSGYEVEKFQALAKLYRDVSLEIDWSGKQIQQLSNEHQKLLKETYNRSIKVLEAPELVNGALSDTLERGKITKDYFKHDHGLTYIDNFLTPSALNSIRKFLLGSTIWFDIKIGGYLGAYLKEGLACPLLLQIADDLRINFPEIFKNHQLKQLWAYKYDSRAYKDDNGLTGIKAHADQAAVNVNFWITPATANLNPESGGLIVYNTPAPLEWDFKTYNSNEEKIAKCLENGSREKSIVPYNENRVVIFNSNLIHETDRFEFKEGYENRRINVTMLFGRRED
jgi:tetratricopeptide (TPR) repeat protein